MAPADLVLAAAGELLERATQTHECSGHRAIDGSGSEISSGGEKVLQIVA